MTIKTDDEPPKKPSKYIGNELNISIRENCNNIIVIGNECRVKVEKNSGCLKVIGNECRVKVNSGNGKINYIGNGGCIQIGDDVNENLIKYIGDDGRIAKGTSGLKFKSSSQNKTTNNKELKKVPMVKLNGKEVNFKEINGAHQQIKIGTGLLTCAISNKMPKIQIPTVWVENGRTKYINKF